MRFNRHILVDSRTPCVIHQKQQGGTANAVRKRPSHFMRWYARRQNGAGVVKSGKSQVGGLFGFKKPKDPYDGSNGWGWIRRGPTTLTGHLQSKMQNAVNSAFGERRVSRVGSAIDKVLGKAIPGAEAWLKKLREKNKDRQRGEEEFFANPYGEGHVPD